MFRFCVKELLEARQRDMAWLAKETRMSYQNIFLITKKNPKKVGLDTLWKLCVALECELTDILKKPDEECGAISKARKKTK